MSEEKNSDTDRIFNGLWNDKDYVNAKLNATKATTNHAPFLTPLATAVDIRCGGSLGTRSVRKQIQALLHFAIGNQKLRINANTSTIHFSLGHNWHGRCRKKYIPQII